MNLRSIMFYNNHSTEYASWISSLKYCNFEEKKLEGNKYELIN